MDDVEPECKYAGYDGHPVLGEESGWDFMARLYIH